jgi:integrase
VFKPQANVKTGERIMARTSSNYNITNKTQRAQIRNNPELGPRPKPYYRQIAPNKRLGWICRENGAGSWIVAERVGGKEKTRVLGQADDFVQADGLDILTFEQAQKKAVGDNPTAPVGKLTVAGALELYLAKLAGTSDYAKEYRSRMEKALPAALKATRVDRLTKGQVEAWQVSLVRTDGTDKQKIASKDTANRTLGILKTALNNAFADDAQQIPSNRAWALVKPYKGVSRPRGDDMEPSQAWALIEAAATLDRALAHFIEAAFLTGARPGELAALDVQHLDVAGKTLHIAGIAKGGKKTGERYISLTQDAVDFFVRKACGREPTAILLPSLVGERFGRGGRSRAIKTALKLAGLPLSASLYTMRHAHISRALEGGQAPQLVADNCGTSIRMIETNYAKVNARTRQAEIERTSPSLRLVRAA